MIPNIYIYKPYLFINFYGLAIFVGLLIFIALIKKNKGFNNLITEDQFYNVIILSIIMGFIGARLFWTIDEWKNIENWYEILMFWQPGYYLLGSVIGILVVLPFYLKKINVLVLPFLDLVAIYAPLLQSISRIGCFLAGCCYGLPTNLPWGIIYKNPDCLISDHLRYIKIHPTQLYSSILLLMIFFIMYYFVQKRTKKSGEIFAIYLILMILERFVVDYLRADREFFNTKYLSFFSINQWVAIVILTITILIFAYPKRQRGMGNGPL